MSIANRVAWSGIGGMLPRYPLPADKATELIVPDEVHVLATSTAPSSLGDELEKRKSCRPKQAVPGEQ
jgi:hypothetical protein